MNVSPELRRLLTGVGGRGPEPRSAGRVDAVDGGVTDLEADDLALVGEQLVLPERRDAAEFEVGAEAPPTDSTSKSNQAATSPKRRRRNDRRPVALAVVVLAVAVPADAHLAVEVLGEPAVQVAVDVALGGRVLAGAAVVEREDAAGVRVRLAPTDGHRGPALLAGGRTGTRAGGPRRSSSR